MDLCKYKNAFGKPNTGIHSYRLFGIAIFDVIITIIAAIIISFIFKVSFIYTLITLFILGILFHKVFCVRTTVDKILFS
jgi:hypothetical protein